MAKFFVCFLLLSVFYVHSVQSIAIQKRSALSSEKPPEIEVCKGTSPCGWLVYDKVTRLDQYFMKNTCRCPKELSCEKDEDNLSVSAYTFRCKEKKNNS